MVTLAVKDKVLWERIMGQIAFAWVIKDDFLEQMPFNQVPMDKGPVILKRKVFQVQGTAQAMMTEFQALLLLINMNFG